MKLVPVILSGGSGTRLWPLSRELLSEAAAGARPANARCCRRRAARLAGVPDVDRPVVVCNETHRFLVAEQLREMRLAAGRHPARAGRPQHRARHRARRARGAGRRGRSDALLLVLPADHVIRDLAAFQAAIRRRPSPRRGAASSSRSASCRARPRPATATSAAAPAPRARCTPIAQFVEKPDLGARAEFIASGEYFWNSGMFMFGARRFLDELRRLRAGHRRRVRARQRHGDARCGFHARRRGDLRRLPQRFGRLRRHGEDARRASWCRSTPAGTTSAPGPRCTTCCRPTSTATWRAATCCSRTPAGCYVHADSRLVAAVGLHDMVIVETADAVLVAPQAKVQDVKKLVARIKAAGRLEHVAHAVHAD